MRQLLTLLLFAACLPVASLAKERIVLEPQIASPLERVDLPADLARYPRSPLKAAANDTISLAWFSFDGPSGGPDPQGWTAVDRTAQLDNFFHVADGTELDGGTHGTLQVLEGAKSLWCGQAATAEVPYCGWASLPGYGNVWLQLFESRSFNTAGDVTISYKIRWDSEAGYDETYVEYENASQQWVTLPVNGGAGRYDGTGEIVETQVVSSAAIGPSTRFRFRFESDGAWSDQDGQYPTDGACIVDSLCVSDSTGVLSFQDFEAEASGALGTVDGDWMAGAKAGFGSFAALYPGFSVLQQDPCVVNDSYFWGWFDDPMVANYACAGFPEQGVWRPGKFDCDALNEHIESPLIPVAGAGDEFILSFQVYRDTPLDNFQFYMWAVRSWVGSCPGDWESDLFVYYGGQKDWYNITRNMSEFVDPSASHIQVHIAAVDMCPVWCIFGCGVPEGACRSHAPLVDDVHVYRVNRIGPVFTVSHTDLFQDTFAEDGTTTGVGRADAARDIAPSSSPTILPGDSICATVSAPTNGLAGDVYTGVGPAVYCYVAAWPPRAGASMEAPEERSGVGGRFPLVDTMMNSGVAWSCFRMDSAFSIVGVVDDRYCFDLNDNVFVPGDTVCYVFAAKDNGGVWRYFSRRSGGQGENFVTDDLGEALNSPMEFQVLPGGGWKRGGDILYVDGADSQPGPPQLFYDSAFDILALNEFVDRYDVLAPSSVESNTPASRVKDVVTQIIAPYRLIVWDSGENARGTIGTGTGHLSKADDFQLLLAYLDSHPNGPGLLLYGDHLASEWGWPYGIGESGVAMQSTYVNFTVSDDDHADAGESVSPLMTASGACFVDQGTPQQLIAFGGCPNIKAFDVLQPTGLATTEFAYPGGAGSAILSQATPNSASSTARVILSGFAFHHTRDASPVFPPVRAEHFRLAAEWATTSAYNPPTGVPEVARDFLATAAPNPFNPETTIRYGIRVRGHVSLRVYNIAGQLVRTLVDDVQSPRHEGFEVTWRGLNEKGREVASGVYLYRLETPSFSDTGKMVLLK